MEAIEVLREVEDFLHKDLASETLSSRSKKRRCTLLSKVTECIKILNDKDQFLNEQCEVSRLHSSRKLPIPNVSENEEENHYIDLTDIPFNNGQHRDQSLLGADSGGSGSGYESYDSDEEVSTSLKSKEEEDLSHHYNLTDYDVFTHVYIENKSMFKGKKWQKRVGVVKEKHFMCFKKAGDTNAVMNFPLRAYKCTFKNKEGIDFVLVTFSTSRSSEVYKFYIDNNKTAAWSKVLKDITMSFIDATSQNPPPVVARPASTISQAPPPPSRPPPPRPGSIQRTPSAGVVAQEGSDTSCQSGLPSQGNPPPVPAGHPSLNQSSAPQINYFGKGIKTAMTDMFKKDKTKKRMMTAENLGADVSGNMTVFDSKNWVKKWCLVRSHQLYIYGKEERPEHQLELKGCSLLPFSDDPSNRPFGFKILKGSKEVVFLEASSADEMGKWVGCLIAETGCAEMPDTEPEYMPMDIRKSVNSTAKEAFLVRKGTMAVHNSTSESEDQDSVYMDLTAVSTESTSSSGVPLPPLSVENAAKSDRRRSYTNDSSRDSNSLPRTNSNKENENSFKSEQLKPEGKKSKSKDKKKPKRHLTASDITLPKEVTQMPEIETVPRTEIGNAKNSHSVDLVEKSDSPNEVREKEIKVEKADVKTRLLTLKVKKDELQKYIEAASTERERGRLQKTLEKVSDEHSELEKQDVKLELELRKLKNNTHESTSKTKEATVSQKRNRPINTGSQGNVLARAQMWEAASKQ